MHFSCVFAFLLTSDAIPFYLCGFFVLLKPFQAGKIRWHTTFVKTLKSFSHNTTQFLEKHFTVLTEIVQCFLEDVEENVIRWLSACCIKKDSYKNNSCNELSLRNGISCQEWGVMNFHHPPQLKCTEWILITESNNPWPHLIIQTIGWTKKNTPKALITDFWGAIHRTGKGFPF